MGRARLVPMLGQGRPSCFFAKIFADRKTSIARANLAARRNQDKPGEIRLTLCGRGHIVSAHWSVPRAQAVYFRLPTRQNAVSPHHPRSARVNDEEGPSKVLRRGACQRESPGGLNDETDSRPAFDCVGSDVGTGGSSPNGTDANGVYVCKPVPSAAGELGTILGGHRENVRSGYGEVGSRRGHPQLVHV
jgi:hypothetical protein